MYQLLVARCPSTASLCPCGHMLKLHSAASALNDMTAEYESMQQLQKNRSDSNRSSGHVNQITVVCCDLCSDWPAGFTLIHLTVGVSLVSRKLHTTFCCQFLRSLSGAAHLAGRAQRTSAGLWRPGSDWSSDSSSFCRRRPGSSGWRP